MALVGAERDLRGQARVIAEVRQMVDAWRGFPLGNAAEAFPDEAPRYEPAADGERAVSETTLHLLLHWFRHEPHILGKPGRQYPFRYLRLANT
jgi:hypothetical protein